MKTVVDVPPK